MGNDQKIYTCVCLEKMEGTEQSIREIRELINKEVPEYYMPQRIFLLEHAEMVEIQNQENLLYLLNKRCDTEHEYADSKNKYEFVLCTIFSNILKVGKVGVNDNFFSLGGNFSMASQLVEEIRNAFRTEIPIPFILRTDLTVYSLATQLYAYRLLNYDSKRVELMIDDMIPLEV